MVTKIGYQDLNLRLVLIVLEQILFAKNMAKTIRVSTKLTVMFVLGVASQAIELEIVLSYVLRVSILVSQLS